MSKETIKLALEAAYLAGFNASGEGYNGEYPFGDRNQNPEEDTVWIKDRDNALREALAEPTSADYAMGYAEGFNDACKPAPQKPIIKSYLKKDNSQPVKWSDYEPDGMYHNKPQKRPQNCGTGYCSCIECVMEPAQQEPTSGDYALGYAEGFNDACKPAQQEPVPWSQALEDVWARALHLEDAWAEPDEVSQPAQQEPVAWRWSESGGVRWFDWTTDWSHYDRAKAMGFPIQYAAPQPAQRTWVGLTHEEHMEIMTGTMTTSSRMAAVEAKLKEKNGL